MKNDMHCYLSEVGHNNFYYPTKKKAILKTNSKLQVLPWLCSNKNLFAVKVKNKDILMINHDERCYVIWQHTWKIL